jgi:hypothetical protein
MILRLRSSQEWVGNENCCGWLNLIEHATDADLVCNECVTSFHRLENAAELRAGAGCGHHIRNCIAPFLVMSCGFMLRGSLRISIDLNEHECAGFDASWITSNRAMPGSRTLLRAFSTVACRNASIDSGLKKSSDWRCWVYICNCLGVPTPKIKVLPCSWKGGIKAAAERWYHTEA